MSLDLAETSHASLAMSFKRASVPQVFTSGFELTKDLGGIGILLASQRSENQNIEDTLLAASLEGMNGDLRTLGLLVDWVDIHLPFVNADRLQRALKANKDSRVLAFWVSIAQRHKQDRRFAALSRRMRGKRVALMDGQNDFLIARHSEDPRFVSTCLIAPNHTLRHRPGDILTPKQLTEIHLTYRYRVIMGPSYRADMWAQLELTPGVSAAELARKCYGSFATAWKVIEDRKLVAA